MKKPLTIFSLIVFFIFFSTKQIEAVKETEWDENFEEQLSEWTVINPSGCVIEIQQVSNEKISPVGGRNLLIWRRPGETGECYLTRKIEPHLTKGKVSLWFYDNTNDSANVMDLGVAIKDNEGHRIWIAVRSSLNKNNYFIYLNGQEIDSGVLRSFGWHLFEYYLNVNINGSFLSIDDRDLKDKGIDTLMKNFAEVKVFSGWNTPGAARIDGISVFSNPVNVDGIYPHLTFFGDERNYLENCCNETGIGALVAWANKLWAVTYPPHSWLGSADWLYIIDPLKNMDIFKFPQSVGGTHAARMIHQESNQLIIGPYFIKSDGTIRVIPPSSLPGRLTAVTRHLMDPANKVYFYTMEQGLYEVNVYTLQVTELHADGNKYANSNVGNNIPNPIVPGAHGKGAYTGQGRLIIANNGSRPAHSDEGGVLAEWRGIGNPADANSWTVVNRGSFTDVSGPGGIYGAVDNNAPVWAIGWDKRSAVLKLLDNGIWYTYRLPKASYTFDPYHGWYTEWPRFHKIDDNFSIMDAHGMFFNFPNSFKFSSSGGIRPLSSHLSIVNSITKWGNQIVMAGNDAYLTTSGYNNFLKKPQSNIRFLNQQDLNSFGPKYGNGAVWYRERILANATSDPYLIAGFDLRTIHFSVRNNQGVNFIIEIDKSGNGNWSFYQNVPVEANGYKSIILPKGLQGEWIRFKVDKEVEEGTVFLSFNSPFQGNNETFKCLASENEPFPRSEGILRPRDEILQAVFNTFNPQGGLEETGYYEIGKSLQIEKVSNPQEMNNLLENFSPKERGFQFDEASVFLERGGIKYRFPKSSAVYSSPFSFGWPRLIRSVAPDRYLMNLQGTFYELPYDDAGGIMRVKPIATHNKMIYDFASWRGMLVLSGALNDVSLSDLHCFRSTSGKVGLWFGALEDLWLFGPPQGTGGPWFNSPVKAGEYSDPYLMAGYLYKKMEVSHKSFQDVVFTLEVDFAGDGVWHKYKEFSVPPGATFTYIFPEGYNAHWVRIKSNTDTKATAIFKYASKPFFSLQDIKILLSKYSTNDSQADLNSDGKVNGVDFGGMVNY